MKTKMRTLIALAVLVTCILPKTSFGQLQCNYNVHNDLSCSVKVQVDYYDTGGLCNSQTKTINATSTNNFNCGGCGTLTDIHVTLLDAGGTPIGFTVMLVNDGMDTPTGSSACGVSNIIMNYAQGDTSIHF